MSNLSVLDPVLELMGWKAEPLLLRRLAVYIFESAVELAALSFTIYLAEVHLKPAGLFVRLLLLPLHVVIVKFFLSLHLAIGYCRVGRADVLTAISRMSTVHSRSFWSCSAATLTCLSCVLMVWHAIMFLLMTGYSYSNESAFAVRFMLGSSAAFVMINWALWRDFVNHYKDQHEEPEDVKLLYQIFRLHKSKTIRVFTYEDLKRNAESAEAAVASSCVVCLEQFNPTDTVVQLPCGHPFHPTCAHKWILEDWRCPFRCSLDAHKLEEERKRGGVASSQAARWQFDLEEVNEEVDLEANLEQDTGVEERPRSDEG